ncbi:hypothetical protein RCL1_006051 [Eukaryota sp. TZLM3-RCL]
MISALTLIEGTPSESFLLRKHPDEKHFGVQLAVSNAGIAKKAVKFINDQCDYSWISINSACPIDCLTSKGMGAAMMSRPSKLQSIVEAVSTQTNKMISIKIRQGISEPTVHNWIGDVADWSKNQMSVMMHGRTAQARYSKSADYEYLSQINDILSGKGVNFVGNGDVYLPSQLNHLYEKKINHVAVGRAALYKPWVFKELIDGQIYDVTGSERMEIVRKFCNYGLSFHGSDVAGVETTRKFCLEFLSFFTRYVPVGILAEPHYLNLRAPLFIGRNDSETMLASRKVEDWVKITEMFLGKRPSNFQFIPKHKSKV